MTMSATFRPPPAAKPVGPPLPECGSDLVRIEDLSIHYRGRAALRNVCLPIAPGRITALIGPSGCGKTSLLLCLNRLLDLVPGARTVGRIRFGDEDILASGTDVLRLRKRVGMVFQRPNPFPFSVRRNFDLVFAEAGLRSREIREARMIECLKAVGLHGEIGGRLGACATELSGGQQQRLCIARALATNPEVLLLDEPCSALDPISTMAIERLLVSLKPCISLVIVTHNLPQARRIADDCALFWTEDGAGCLLEHGPISRLVDAPCSPITADYIHGRLA